MTSAESEAGNRVLAGMAVFGEEDLNDTRCGACGSFLFSVVREGAFVHVSMGSLVDAPTIRPTKHIFRTWTRS